MFTPELGTSDSQLGDIVLGFGTTAGTTTNKSPSNALTFAQALSLNRVSGIPLFSGLTLAHSVGLNKTLGKSTSNTLTLSQSVTVEKRHPTSNTLTLTQTVSYQLVNAARNQLTFTQVVDKQATLNKTATSIFGVYHTVGVTKVLHISVGNTLALSQTTSGASVKSAANTINFVQTVEVIKATPARNILTLQHNVVVNVVKRISINQTLALGQTAARTLSKTYHVGNSLGFSQSVRKWKEFDLSVSNSLTFTQEAVRERFLRTATNVITFAQTVSVQKVMRLSASNHLSLTQAATKAATLNFSLSNHLTFLNTHAQYVPIGGLGVVNIDNLQVVNIHTYSYPKIGTTHPPRRIPPYCVLSVPERAINLPAPEWNDSEAYQGLFNIRRSMVGGTWTYVHKPNLDHLKYEFVFGLRKARELEDYLINFNSRVHTLINWKGEIWYVFITNNPLDMTAKSRYSNGRGNANDDREKIAVTIEFEGKRIN
jgi:hypothetical protein